MSGPLFVCIVPVSNFIYECTFICVHRSCVYLYLWIYLYLWVYHYLCAYFLCVPLSMNIPLSMSVSLFVCILPVCTFICVHSRCVYPSGSPPGGAVSSRYHHHPTRPITAWCRRANCSFFCQHGGRLHLPPYPSRRYPTPFLPLPLLLLFTPVLLGGSARFPRAA